MPSSRQSSACPFQHHKAPRAVIGPSRATGSATHSMRMSTGPEDAAGTAKGASSTALASR